MTDRGRDIPATSDTPFAAPGTSGQSIGTGTPSSAASLTRSRVWEPARTHPALERLRVSSDVGGEILHTPSTRSDRVGEPVVARHATTS
jgi:hypothetical protein